MKKRTSRQNVQERHMKKRTNMVKRCFDWVCLFLFFVEWLQRVLSHSWYTKTPSIFSYRPANLNRPMTDTFCCLTRLLLIYTLIFYKLKPGILCLYWKNFIRATILQQQAWHSRATRRISLSLFSQSSINIKWPKRRTSFSLFICAWNIYFTFFFSILVCTQTCLK